MKVPKSSIIMIGRAQDVNINSFWDKIKRDRVLLYKSPFFLNFETKVLKMKFKNVTVPARRSTCLPKSLFQGQAFRPAGVFVVTYLPCKIREGERKRCG